MWKGEVSPWFEPVRTAGWPPRGRPTVDRAGFRIAQPNDDGVVIRLVVMSGQGGLQISVGNGRAAAVGRGAGHRGRRAAGASRRRRVTVASPEILARWPFLPRRRRPVRAARRSPHPDSAPAPRRVTRSSYGLCGSHHGCETLSTGCTSYNTDSAPVMLSSDERLTG